MPRVVAARQVVHMGDEDDPDACLGHRTDDLAGDLRTLALVGGREGLIAQQKGPVRDVAGYRTHPGQFLIQLPLLHRGVFLALEVREDPRAGAGGERLRRHEHPRLRHQLGQAQAAQEGRLSSLVSAGDHDQPLAVRVQVVADGPGLDAQRQADVIQTAGGQAGLIGAPRGRAGRDGKADRLALGGKPLPQVQAADVEPQLGAEHLEKAPDMVDGLSQRVRGAVEAAAFQLRQHPHAGLVLRGQHEGISRPFPARQAIAPALLRLPLQRVADALAALSQPGADQHAASERQLAELVRHLGEVIIAQLLGEHGEEPREAFGAEPGGFCVADLPQAMQLADEQLHRFPGAVQDGVRRVPEKPAEDMLLPDECRHGDLVEAAHRAGLVYAIG